MSYSSIIEPAYLQPYAAESESAGKESRESFKRAMHKEVDPKDLQNKDLNPVGHGGSHPYLVHEFVDAVYHDRQPATNIWEASRYMAMGILAHKSALRDGETLDVPDWGDAPR